MEWAQPARNRAIVRRPGRVSSALRPLVPALGLAYPLLIQPLIELRSRTDEALDLTANAANAESSPLNQAFWLTLLALAAWLFRRDGARLGSVLAQPATLFTALYLCLAAASVAWSPVPGIAARRLILQTVVVLLMLVAPQLVERRERVLAGVVWLFAAAALVNAPLALLLPAGRMGGALGIYSNKNILGLAMALALIVLIYGVGAARSVGERAMLVIAALAAALALVLSEAETSILLAVGLPCMVWAIFRVARLVHARIMLALAALVLWALCGALFYGASGGTAAGLAELAFGDATLSGRTEIWQFARGAIDGAPLLGTGYASFWGAGDDSYVSTLAPGFIAGLNQAHNGYIDVLIETGAAGLTLLTLILVAGLAALDWGAPDSDRPLRRLAMVTMLFAIFHNGLESSWFRGFSIVWISYLLMLAMLLHRSVPRVRHPAR